MSRSGPIPSPVADSDTCVNSKKGDLYFLSADYIARSVDVTNETKQKAESFEQHAFRYLGVSSKNDQETIAGTSISYWLDRLACEVRKGNK